jgi:predicted nucleic acid-binding protein
MNNVLIDTDVLIEILRGNQRVFSFAAQLQQEKKGLFYSPVTKAEIVHGMRTGEEDAINALFPAMECVVIDDTMGKQAGLYLARFYRSHNLQIGDAFIAATAKVSKMSLLTNKRKHYPMPDLEILTPGR